MTAVTTLPIATNEEKIATLHRTLDWLEANPDKATRGQLARDAEGDACDPHYPEAVCFCFIGRLVVEADIKRPSYFGTYSDGVEAWFEPLGATYDLFMIKNDRTMNKEKRFKTLRKMIGELA